MKTIDRIKKECENRGLNFETVKYNMLDIEQYRYIDGQLYLTKTYIAGKPNFSKEYISVVNLEDYQ